MRRGIFAFAVVSLTFCSLPSLADGPLRRVLVLYPYHNEHASAPIAVRAMRERLAELLPDRIEFYNDFVDLGRFPGEAHQKAAARYLADKHAQTTLDLVVAVGPEALRFAVKHRAVLAFSSPIIFCCLSPVTLATIDLPGDITGLVSEIDLGKTLALAERLQPNARHLAVITGASIFDRQWEQTARRQLAAQVHRYHTRYLSGLPYDTLLKEVAALPRDTIVIVLTIFEDGTGQRYIPSDIAEEVARASNAPLFSPFAPFRGVVGGYVDRHELVGAALAELSAEILTGKCPNSLPPRLRTAHSYVVDARQLKRWQLSEDNLPTGTVILFKEPSLWELHRGAVLATMATLLALTAVLMALLIQMRRRKQTERLLRESEERLESLQDEERQRIAGDLHDSTAQHLTAIGLNLMRFKEGMASDASTLDALQDMKQSLQEATRELRTFTYLLHPPALQRDGLDRTLQRYVEEFGRRTGLETKIRSNLGQHKPSLPLQRSILRIVQEALANVHRHASASRVSVHLRLVGKQLHLLISDDGRGIEEISKRRGDPLRVGVGIQGMVSRVKQFGGKLDVRSRSTGTTVHAVVRVR